MIPAEGWPSIDLVTRMVDRLRTVRYGSARYSVPGTFIVGASGSPSAAASS